MLLRMPALCLCQVHSGSDRQSTPQCSQRRQARRKCAERDCNLSLLQVLDASGNWNNVLEVFETPPVLTSRERLALARWHAGHLALETKMVVRS